MEEMELAKGVVEQTSRLKRVATFLHVPVQWWMEHTGALLDLREFGGLFYLVAVNRLVDVEVVVALLEGIQTRLRRLVTGM